MSFISITVLNQLTTKKSNVSIIYFWFKEKEFSPYIIFLIIEILKKSSRVISNDTAILTEIIVFNPFNCDIIVLHHSIIFITVF